MASKTSTSASIALLLLLNATLFLTATACGGPCPPKPKPKPSPGPPSGADTCPIDALKLGVCADVLNGLLNLTIGKPPKEPCCSLLSDLADAEASVCLCTAIKAGLLGSILDIPVGLSLLINYCGKHVPKGFQCP